MGGVEGEEAEPVAEQTAIRRCNARVQMLAFRLQGSKRRQPPEDCHHEVGEIDISQRHSVTSERQNNTEKTMKRSVIRTLLFASALFGSHVYYVFRKGILLTHLCT